MNIESLNRDCRMLHGVLKKIQVVKSSGDLTIFSSGHHIIILECIGADKRPLAGSVLPGYETGAAIGLGAKEMEVIARYD